VSRGTLDNPAADVLRVLAVSRSTGALDIRGVPAGTIFLHEGDVTYAEAPGTAVPEPAVTPGRDPAFGEAVRAAVFETGLLLLTAPRGRGERPLFRPGRRHWTGATCRLGVDAVLSEVERRAARLADLGVPPDAEIRLRGLRRGRRVVLTAEEWRVVTALDGVGTPRALAWRSGTSLTAAVRAVASLVQSGICQAVPEAVPETVPETVPDVPVPEAVPLVPDAVTSPPEPPGGPAAPVAPPALPRRARAGVSLPPPPSPAPASERTGEWSLADKVELAERVLAGLRRL
jgi:hypothetical protein